MQGESNLASSLFIYPLTHGEAPAQGRTPEGEGANLDRRLVPYHGKCKRSNLASSLYISIYLRSTVLFCDGMRRLGTGNTKESNNKSTESSRTETESKAMRKRSKYFNVGVNET